MLYSGQEVLDYVREEKVKFVKLAFCDIFGQPKNVSILSSELENAFADGISFDASAVRGFGGVAHSDLFLFPDPSTMTPVPWRPTHGRVIRMYCEVRDPSGKKSELDSRTILKRAVEQAASREIECYFGAEQEFYLFKTDELGARTLQPIDEAGYMDTAPDDAGENVRREICLSLEEMGISPEASHHEEGPGQNEIDFRYSDPLRAADNTVTFKAVVRSVAERSGLWASFDPKPLTHKSGNGMHINISPRSPRGGDVFSPFMAGIMEHIREITLFLNPTEGSYERLGSHKAPRFVSWSPENRSQLIRIPASTGERKRFELRSPDPLTNPYLAFALLIYAGLDGVERGLTPPEPVELDLFYAPDSVTRKLLRLPATRAEAASLAASSDFVRKHLPQEIIDLFVQDN
ncbi:MAG: glutamine synthetase family protein [Oscillospiraceae bacterium]|jgi:glutamine synthetase|nr:glutamine synthetase family protein [Oscillospiraceae bacterium]